MDVDGRPLLTADQVDALGRDLDAIRQREIADLGEIDSTYIRRLVAVQRSLEIGGRGLLFLSFLPPAWIAGVAALSVSKILDNMEIGHNVMHGQYDWMNDPNLHSSKFEWDSAAPSKNWRHGHNVMHHTYTNIIGKDRDIGYGIIRMSEHERWTQGALFNPIKAFLLAALFQWGVALHDVEAEKILSGDKTLDEAQDVLKAIGYKAAPPGVQGLRAVPRPRPTDRPRRARGQRRGEPGPQPVGLHDHLLRPLPRRGRPVHRGGGRERNPRRVVPAPDARFGQPDRRSAVPHHERQPVPPDRAPPVPRPARSPLRRDRA